MKLYIKRVMQDNMHQNDTKYFELIGPSVYFIRFSDRWKLKIFYVILVHVILC